MAAHRTVYELNAPSAAVVDAALAPSERAVFWLQDCVRQRYDQLTSTTAADLTVVGGGYAGLWTAVQGEAAQPGGPRVAAGGAGDRLGRIGPERRVLRGQPDPRRRQRRARWPDEFDELERLGAGNLDAFEADVAELGLDCQFERPGLITAAVETHQLAWAEGAGHLTSAEIRAEINSPIFLGGTWDRDGCALLHPARLAHELARVATELGVEIHEHSQVTELDSSRTGPVQVRTARGGVRSGTVALATNVFPRCCAARACSPCPSTTTPLMTEPLSATQQEAIGWRNRQGLADMANQFHYIRPRPTAASCSAATTRSTTTAGR